MLKKVKLDELTEISLSEMICQQINGNKLKINKSRFHRQVYKTWIITHTQQQTPRLFVGFKK